MRLLIFLALCIAAPLKAQKPVYPLSWTEQLPPTMAKATLGGGCLNIESQLGDFWHYPTVITTRSATGTRLFGFTLSHDTTLYASGRAIYIYGINNHRLAVLETNWLASLSGDFAPDTLRKVPCDSLTNRPAHLSVASLELLLNSPLVQDTLEVVIGRLARPVGMKSQSIALHGDREAAGYDETRDSMFFDLPRLPTNTHLRYALLHEYGHRFDSHTHQALSPFVPIKFSPSLAHLNQSEYRADLCAYALSLLSLTSSLTPVDAYALGTLYDYLLPGTLRATGYFLRYPLFQRNPLFPYKYALERGEPLDKLAPAKR